MLAKTMDVHAASMRVGTKVNVHRIENNNLKACLKNMSTERILWHTTWFLAYKHRVGLLMASTLATLAYVAYDKLTWLF